MDPFERSKVGCDENGDRRGRSGDCREKASRGERTGKDGKVKEEKRRKNKLGLRNTQFTNHVVSLIWWRI